MGEKRCDRWTTDLTEGRIWCQREAGHAGNHRWSYTVEWPDMWCEPRDVLTQKRP